MVAKYSMFITSLLESRYAWFYKDLCQTNQIDGLLIDKDDLELMIGYFRTACVKNSVKKAAVVEFLEFLSE